MPKQQRSILRVCLLIGAIGWGISVFFTITPWSISMDQLQRMGAKPVAYQPLLDYWLKMASAVFVGIGALFFMAFLQPEKHRQLIPYLGIFSLVMGVVLLIAAISNELNTEQHPTFVADISFCLLVGLGILGIRKTMVKEIQ